MLSSGNLDTKMIGDKFILLKKKQLGAGAFSQVFEGFVRGKPEEKVAIKVLQNLPTNIQDQLFEKLRLIYQREREIHKVLESEHVVKMIDVLICGQSTHLILELCEQGNLHTMLSKEKNKRLTQESAYNIFCQIVQGYKALYDFKVLHRDLKPQNILFTKGIAKIADFGFAKLIEEMDLAVDQTIVGTLLYQAPEMMVGSKYSSKVDIWSLGIIFYEMLYGVLPFIENHPTRLYKKITSEPLKFPQDVQVNQIYIDLIIKMLKVDQEQRIRWDDLFLMISKNSANQIFELENLSAASTQMSQSEQFRVNYQRIEDRLNQIDEVKDFFDYVQKLITFSNNNTNRLFFLLYSQLQLSQNLYILFIVTSTKYLINEYNYYIQILTSSIPPSEIGFKEMDIKTFKSCEEKYYSVLNQFKTNHDQMNKYYNEKLQKEFDKLLQITSDQPKQLVQTVNQIVQSNRRSKVSLDNFNKVYFHCIQEISKSIKKNQNIDDATLRQIYTLQIYLFYSLYPQKFIKNDFEPKHLEQELIQSSTQKLQNKVFDLTMTYSALIK